MHTSIRLAAALAAIAVAYPVAAQTPDPNITGPVHRAVGAAGEAIGAPAVEGRTENRQQARDLERAARGNVNAAVRADARMELPPVVPGPNVHVNAILQENDVDRWRYVYHENNWWFYTPQNQWMIYRDNNWSNYAPAPYTTAYRGYYYNTPTYNTVPSYNTTPNRYYNYGPGYRTYRRGGAFGRRWGVYW